MSRSAPPPPTLPPGPDRDRARWLLLRYSGEVSTKARPTRRQFSARLAHNVGEALRFEDIEASIETTYDRMLLTLSDPSASARALEALARCFGVQTISLAERHACASLDDVVASGAVAFRPCVTDRRFAVRARFVGNPKLSFRARDIDRELGTALLPISAGVDLDHPEFTARVELYSGHAYHCVETWPGPGGLPLGTGGRAMALVSGGFDSGVAAWQLLRRGVALDHLFCNLGGRSHELGVLRVMKKIAEDWGQGDRARLHAVDFDAVSRDIQATTEARYWQVLLKRSMLRAAEQIAREIGAEALVTGEAVGQVSSQTLTNLAVISDVTRVPILRPLVGTNKEEIIEQARRIGTEPLSAAVGEYCALVPRNPATAARLDVVLHQEARLDPEAVPKAVANREVVDLHTIDPDDRVVAGVAVDRVPDGAQLIDLRNRADFDAWHPPGAVHLDFPHALRAHPSFARDGVYLLYCEFGLKSAHLAELMHAAGFRAHHFRGGSRALRRRLEGPGR